MVYSQIFRFAILLQIPKVTDNLTKNGADISYSPAPCVNNFSCMNNVTEPALIKEVNHSQNSSGVIPGLQVYRREKGEVLFRKELIGQWLPLFCKALNDLLNEIQKYF